MVYYVHERATIEAAKAYQTIYDTYNAIDATDEAKPSAFQNFVIYLMLSPYSNEKVDLLHIAEKNYARELDQNEMLSKFLRKFLTLTSLSS